MLCQICNKKTATIHLTEINDGMRSEMHICEHCAAEQGIAAKSQIAINELLSNLLAMQPTDEEMFGDSDHDLQCPRCGFTLEEFRKQGVLGCPNDYEIFERALLPLIERAHNSKTVHCGKIPAKMPRDTRKQMKISNLHRQLETAVQSEDYERAAKLRDELNQLQQPQ